MNTKKAALTVLSVALKIVVAALVILAVFRLGQTAYDYGHAVFQEEAVDKAPGRTIRVTIPEDSSNIDVARLLEKKGLVNDWVLFTIQIYCSKYADTIEPGTYTLNTSMLPRELMAVMSGEELEEDE